MTNQDEQKYREGVLVDLTQRFGHIISVRNLYLILGFTSYDSLKQAVLRGDLRLNLFYVQGRRARHAMAGDVADWLTQQWRKSREQGSSLIDITDEEKKMPTG